MENFCKLFDKLLFPEKNHYDFVETYNDDDRHFHKIDLLKVSLSREKWNDRDIFEARGFSLIFSSVDSSFAGYCESTVG